MADAKELARQYLEEAHVFQLATARDNKPWICNVHFYSDDDFNVYWMSHTNARHSQEVAANPHAAIALKIHEDTPKENYVIGLSLTGRVEVLQAADNPEICEKYFAKLGIPPAVRANILSGKNPGALYQLEPDALVLFDTLNFNGNPRQEIAL